MHGLWVPYKGKEPPISKGKKPILQVWGLFWGVSGTLFPKAPIFGHFFGPKAKGHWFIPLIWLGAVLAGNFRKGSPPIFGAFFNRGPIYGWDLGLTLFGGQLSPIWGRFTLRTWPSLPFGGAYVGVTFGAGSFNGGTAYFSPRITLSPVTLLQGDLSGLNPGGFFNRGRGFH